MQDYQQYGYDDRHAAAATAYRNEMLQRADMSNIVPFSKVKSAALQDMRPDSVATEFVDLDWAESEAGGVEDDEDTISEFEDIPQNSARNSLDSGSKSMTTVSSYDEATTPRSSRGHEMYAEMQSQDFDPASFYARPTLPLITITEDRRPAVEGPRGPHLFRLSDSSFLQTDEHVLSLSPITPKVDVSMSEVRHRSLSLLGSDNARTRTSIFWPETEFEGGFSSPPIEAPRPSPRSYYSSAELNTAKLTQWTPSMVAQSMLNAGVDVMFADKFIEHDIGGAILGTLKQEDLKELSITSFGMRTQIWTHIKILCDLKPASPLPPTPVEDALAAVTQGAKNLRRQASTINRQRIPARRPSRRHQPGSCATVDNIISPMDSISIVGIEQLIPKQHTCKKGEACKNYWKSKRVIEQFRLENPNVDMQMTGNVLIAGDPGNAATAPRLDICSPITPTVQSPFAFSRPSSDAVPSVVASSDVLGPGPGPKIQPYLQAEVLNTLQKRDPQDNVKQFLDFQRAHVPISSEVPPTPPFELFPQNKNKQQSDSRLRGLPKLAIPGKAPLTPHQVQPVNRTRRISLGKSGLSQVTNAEESPESPPRSASVQSSPRSIASANTSPATGPVTSQFHPYAMNKASPLAQELVSPIGGSRELPRFGTPFSEMDVPVTRVNMGPITRDISQSVPPEMTLNHSYTNAMPVRSQSRASHRRPSFSVLPALDENRAIPTPIIPKTTTPSPTRIVRAGSVPPPSGTLKAPPRINYPWSPIERTRPFETAIPPRAIPTKAATVPAPRSSAASISSSTASASSASVHSSQTSLSPASSAQSMSPTSITSVTNINAPAPLSAGITHAGTMKKRRTHFLRHEWQEGFFTLKGTRLAMHKDDKSTARTLEYVDIDDYAVACSSLASQSKLSAKFKVANIRRGSDKPKDDVASFSFQLVPGEKHPPTSVSSTTTSSSANGLGNATMSSAGGPGSRLKKRLSALPVGTNSATTGASSGSVSPPPDGAVNGTGKTHHFAVKHRKEQMTWMRELMLAKAMKQKGDGFEVSVNGNMI